ncbi:MAG: hypothetical protein GX442_13345 [Candidatus Riflebacteria bacterium]|nr:hypothetical protein [Candidatus Riflebacteria bacterium]
MRSFGRLLVASFVMGALLLPSAAQAGKPTSQKKKPGFFQKIGQGFQKVGDKIQNGVMDAGVAAKKKVTGKKNRVWVCGHRNKKGQHVKGHWRILKKGKGSGQTGQTGQTGQSGQEGQTGDQGQGQPGGADQPPLPPTDEPPADDPPATEPGGADQPPATPGEEPPADQPPATEPGGADQPPQPKTLGQFMNSLADMSDDLDAVKDQAVQAKKGKTKKEIAQSVQLADDYEAMANERESDAKLLTKVVTNDLDSRNGKPGAYYTSYLHNLKKMHKADREAIADVTGKILSFARQRAGTGSKGNAYKERVTELSKF